MSDNLPATVAEEYGTGLEDIEDDLTSVPRIGINHKGGTFKDSLSGEEFPTIYGVALGVVKQRVMWAEGDIEPGAKPQCKSQDAKVGFPNVGDVPEDQFPWDEAPGLDEKTAAKDEHGRTILDCNACPFAEWGPKGRNGKSKPPRCRERLTMPVVYSMSQVNGYEEGTLVESGIVSFQGSGVRPMKQFLSSFSRAKRPMYSAVIQIGLDMNKKGTVEYSVPNFKKIAEVPEGEWELFARDWPGMREWLTRAPRAGDDSDPAKGGMSAAAAAANVVQATVVTPDEAKTWAEEAAAAPAATPAASVVNAVVTETSADDDGELPF